MCEEWVPDSEQWTEQRTVIEICNSTGSKDSINMCVHGEWVDMTATFIQAARPRDELYCQCYTFPKLCNF